MGELTGEPMGEPMGEAMGEAWGKNKERRRTGETLLRSCPIRARRFPVGLKTLEAKGGID
jgi:hypothetical protein